MIVICEPHRIWYMPKYLSFSTWPNMSLVSPVAFNITEPNVNYTIDLALALGRCKGSDFISFLLMLLFKDIF
jgi:hypothetical protein